MQGYFQRFPTIAYDLKGNGTVQLVRNIVHRLRVRDVIEQNASVFYQWVVRDGETPEIIAHKYYGDSQFHILVILANDIIDPVFDWPLTYTQFNAWMEKEYGDLPTAYQTLHHHEDGEGNWIDLTDYNSRTQSDRAAVSCYDYWFKQNESKRPMKLINKTYASRVMEEISQLLNVRE